MLECVREILLIILAFLQIEETPIMSIEIPKIDVKEKIYEKDSIENDINKHVIIMQESNYPNESGNVIIGAHSGTGPLAYFKDLDKISIGDQIIINYKDNKYIYTVKNIHKDNKDGKISIRYYDNSIILFTCYPNDKNNYLIITGTLQV